jgi:hypothetical protein
LSDWVFEAVGLLGVFTYLGSYALLQLGFVRGSGYAYAAMNILAAFLVLISLAESFNLSSALIQVSWILLSAVGMIRFYYLHHTIRFTTEEKSLVASKLPHATRIAARRFLDAGLWHDGSAGDLLMKEGEVHSKLIYLGEGQADVMLGQQVVGECLPDAFLGELTVLTGGAATATVALAGPARYFEIGASALERLMGRDDGFRIIMEGALARDAGRKLIAANLRIAEK